MTALHKVCEVDFDPLMDILQLSSRVIEVF